MHKLRQIFSNVDIELKNSSNGITLDEQIDESEKEQLKICGSREILHDSDMNLMA